MEGHKAAVSWLAQQHRKTRHAVYPKHSRSAAGWHSSTEKQGMQFTLNTAAVHWCLVTANLYAKSGCS